MFDLKVLMLLSTSNARQQGIHIDGPQCMEDPYWLVLLSLSDTIGTILTKSKNIPKRMWAAPELETLYALADGNEDKKKNKKKK